MEEQWNDLAAAGIITNLDLSLSRTFPVFVSSDGL
jgi:hypothetical protein